MAPRHSSSRPRRNPAARRVVLAGAAVVAVALLVGLLVSVVGFMRDGGSCDGEGTVTVAVEPALESVARSLAARASDAGCHEYDVTPMSSSDFARTVADRASLPDLWIPDSAVRLAQVSQDVQVPFTTVLNSVASTPVVIAWRDAKVNLSSWTTVLATQGLSMGDPTRDGVADAPILAGTSEVEAMRTTKEALGASLATLAQGQSGREGEPPSESTLVGEVVATGGAAIVSERQGVDALRARPDSGLQLQVPRSGAVFLTYPLAVVTQDSGRRGVATGAADALRDAATSADFTTTLHEAGFRGADRAPLEGAGVGDVEALVVRDPARLESALQRWRLLSLPSRAYVLVDTSGSMATPVEGSGRTRIQTLLETASLGLGKFPDDAALGVWAFGGNAGPPGKPYKEVAKVAALGSATPEGTQRQTLGAALQQLPGLVGGGTDLYRAVLDAHKAALDSYDPKSVNSIIVISDGANDNVSELSKEDFLAKLKAQVDPSKPVIVVTVGILEADQATLAEIAKATGGSSHVAKTPEEIAKVFAQAIQQRGAA